MATYQDIENANKKMNLMPIKGKDYAQVNQRVKAFRMVYPEGFIITHLKSLADGVCVMESKVGYYGDDGSERVLGSGTAYEKENSTPVNKTSYIENCETSAVGRALGMAGFGIDTNIASAEELQNALDAQGASKDVHNILVCKNCGAKITEQEHDWSVKFKGVPLCRDCQFKFPNKK